MIDTKPALRNLKDFQRRTVNYVFKRMYKHKRPALRFLIADEVGLGKTLIARGIIAKAIEKMQKEGVIDRIDVVYVCSNGAIARQNINRLNVTGEKNVALATRLTLLPLRMAELEKRKLNFVSFTPGTTFDLKSSTGVINERALIWKMLCSGEGAYSGEGFRKMLRCGASIESWDRSTNHWNIKQKYNRNIARRFLKAVLSDEELDADLRSTAYKFNWHYENPSTHLRHKRNKLISRLRAILAGVCVSILEPDIVILDEFQRFRGLLQGDSDAALLARQLMEYKDEKSNTHARVILLSATPYKMYTISDEDEDHYSDFMQTLQFLYGDSKKVKKVRKNLEEFRISLYDCDNIDPTRIDNLRDSIEKDLLKVMVRTERISLTRERDAMVKEIPIESSLESSDLNQACAIDNIAQYVGSRNTIEYWKSAPYLLNFMREYDLKKKFNKYIDESNRNVLKAFKKNLPYMLDRKAINEYEPIDPGNARLRSLLKQTVEKGMWKLLWLPPSMPYTQPGGVYANIPHMTKALVFSSWTVVPDALSAVCSYEAERRMVRASGIRIEYSELHRKISQFLRFHVQDGQLTGMSSLAMLYPSPVLAGLIDPLDESINNTEGELIGLDDLKNIASNRISRSVLELNQFQDPLIHHERRWSWAALAKFDTLASNRAKEWCQGKKGWKKVGTGSERESKAFPEHVDYFCEVFSNEFLLGNIPDELVEMLVELALGSPAVCAARAFKRIAPSLAFDDPELMSAAAIVANGFRSLYNNPETQLLLRSIGDEDLPLWRIALNYAIDGNLQAVLDEYAHVLKESLGLFDHSDVEIVQQVSEAMFEALSIRAPNITVDDLSLSLNRRKIRKDTYKLRCRFALRFADIKDDSENILMRAGTVRQAFNSPFRPFILASTSVGQEGLDFHSYCHSIWHWNLPSNPVDMEQREGRIHRYKGHAIRKNISQRYGITAFKKAKRKPLNDPWDSAFRMCKNDRPEELNDLYPYWIFDNVESPFKIERIIPLLPFSREIPKLDKLKKSLALYRLVFGQPRQEDLLAYLVDVLDESELDRFRISLQP